jgi:hypothetical protein
MVSMRGLFGGQGRRETRHMRRKPFLYPVAMSLILLCCFAPVRAAAEVRLSGTEDNIVLQAENATVPEILTSIQAAFNLKIELRGSTDRQFTGTYRGPVRRVLFRLLEGTDHVIRSAPGEMSIVLLGPSGAVKVGVARNGASPGVAAVPQVSRVSLQQGKVTVDEPDQNARLQVPAPAGNPAQPAPPAEP